MKIWLDDERMAPLGWTWCQTHIEVVSAFSQFANICKECKESDEITHISLDYELKPACGDGVSIATWISEQAREWYKSIKFADNPIEKIDFKGIGPICVTFHSSSYEGCRRMNEQIQIAHMAWQEGLLRLSAIQLAKELNKDKRVK